jgi:hypothetical protein
MSLIEIAALVAAATSAASSGELVTGGALAPPPQPLPSAAPPSEPPWPHQASPNDVYYTRHAYTGHNLFGNFEGIQKLDLALDVLTVPEHSQIRDMQQHGDLLGGQKLLLRGIASHLIPLRAEGAPLGALATLAGYYIAIASDCELPTAPIEAALDKILLGGGIAPSEGDRYKYLMIQSRGAFAGAGTVLGCSETKRQVEGALHEATQ